MEPKERSMLDLVRSVDPVLGQIEYDQACEAFAHEASAHRVREVRLRCRCRDVGLRGTG